MRLAPEFKQLGEVVTEVKTIHLGMTQMEIHFAL